MNWKETVTSVSDKIFPGLSHYDSILNKPNDNEVMSSLPLQILLFLNVIFVPFWNIFIIAFVIFNYNYFNELHKVIFVSIIITTFFVEFLRLYLGYEGNLKDKIPEMAGFWMLSLLLQFPLQAFLLFYPNFYLTIMIKCCQIIMFIFLCLQLIFGYFALKFTARQQVLIFKIMKLGKESTNN